MKNKTRSYDINYSNYLDPADGLPMARGWKMIFPNGCTISVQFGSGTYSDGGHDTAEVAAWMPNGDWIALQPGDDVVGHCTPEQVLQYMNQVAAMHVGLEPHHDSAGFTEADRDGGIV